MLNLEDLDEQLDQKGKNYIYSWHLKILVAKKILVANGYYGHIDSIRRVYEIKGGYDPKVIIFIEEKVNFFKTKRISIDIPLDQYNKVLNETFPLKDADLFHFNKIQEKYMKYMRR
jgi:hypothetical protein